MFRCLFSDYQEILTFLSAFGIFPRTHCISDDCSGDAIIWFHSQDMAESLDHLSFLLGGGNNYAGISVSPEVAPAKAKRSVALHANEIEVATDSAFTGKQDSLHS
jgi:hypothetical protein